jgi:hypothetical protein
MNRGKRLLIAPFMLTMGCIPYVYPKLSYVPGTELGQEASQVYAFRVDAETELTIIGRSEYKLTEIASRADGTLPAQLQATLEIGVAHLPHWNYFSGGCVHETLVRLYRPGYRLIELRPWESTDSIRWQPAPDWQSQKHALIGLIASPRVTSTRPVHDLTIPSTNSSLQSDLVWGHYLPVAPNTLQTQRVFDLATAECERLAKGAPTDEDAAQLRAWAQKLSEMKSPARNELN